MEFFSVAGDEEQGIVGARTEDEHRENPLALPVQDDDVVLGQDVDHGARGRQGHACGEQRDQPQEGASVDEDQDDRDHDRGNAEQRAVDRTEHLDEVGEDPARARHVDVEIWDLRGNLAQALGDGGDREFAVGEVLARLFADQRHIDQDGLAVLRGDRDDLPGRHEVGERLARFNLDAGELGREGRHLVEIGR